MVGARQAALAFALAMAAALAAGCDAAPAAQDLQVAGRPPAPRLAQPAGALPPATVRIIDEIGLRDATAGGAGADPVVTSPVLTLDPARPGVVVVTWTSDACVRDAELRVVAPDGHLFVAIVTDVQPMPDLSCDLPWAAYDVTLRLPDDIATAGAAVGLWDPDEVPGG